MLLFVSSMKIIFLNFLNSATCFFWKRSEVVVNFVYNKINSVEFEHSLVQVNNKNLELNRHNMGRYLHFTMHSLFQDMLHCNTIISNS